MASFYLDRSLAADVADALRTHGHAATRTPLTHNAPDYEHLLCAAQQQWVLVTHNGRDFRLLYGAWQAWPPALGVTGWVAHAGMLVPPQDQRWAAARIAEEIHALVSTTPVLTNAFYEWRPSTGWALWVLSQP